MSSGDFDSTGFLDHVHPGARITRFQVLGERCSGTNFVTRLLGRNSDLRASRLLGWKHGFPSVTAIPPDLAVIGLVRRADDWTLSMHAKPWHCSADMQRLSFADFIRAEWDTCVDRPRYFEGAREDGLIGQPLQQDRHPLTGQRFANIFALRQAKLEGLLSYRNRACSFVLLRMEAVVAGPDSMLDRLLAALGQPDRPGALRPVVKRLGSRFKPALPDRPETPERLSDADLEFLRQNVDRTQERSLGYAY
jgi:hypothetical protein